MARKKSLRQLESQYERLMISALTKAQNGSNGDAVHDTARTKRIKSAYERYVRNIRNSRQYKSDSQDVSKKTGLSQSGGSKEFKSLVGAIKTRHDREYPQSVYMGLVNG